VNDIIAELSIVTDEQAAGLVADSTHADLIAKITATPYRAERRRVPVRKPARTAGLVGAVAMSVAAGIVAAALLINPAGPPRPHPRPIEAEALSFVRYGGYIDVIVRDPLADAKRYNAEFKAHGLHIRLSLVPASPSLVGTVVYFDGTSAIKPITARGRCWTGGGGALCPVGLRVPVHYHGAASLVFGRAARPGEHYETTVTSTSPGEALHGLRVAGRRVGAVLAMIAGRRVTVARYLVESRRRGNVVAHRVSPRFFVYDAEPWAPGQVVLFVGRTRHEVNYVPRTPQPAPTASPAR
jgi:hypothetical protein